MSEEIPTITFEEYEKLQLDFIDSQKELKEMTELFEQYRDETEQMEDVQGRQIEMLEQQLEKANLEKEYLMLTLKKELQEIQIETQKLLVEKDEEVQKLRLDVKIKTQTMTKFMNQYHDELDKENEEKENSDKKENESSNEDKDALIIKLRKEVAVKDFLINDLSVDIKKNKSVIDEQKSMFQKFTAEIYEKTQERDDALKNLREQEIEELKKALKDKDAYIKKLQKDCDPNVSQEENEIMKEMIIEQQEKLLKLAKNFEGYRNESEKLFLAQIELRDRKIKELESKHSLPTSHKEEQTTSEETKETSEVAVVEKKEEEKKVEEEEGEGETKPSE